MTISFYVASVRMFCLNWSEEVLFITTLSNCVCVGHTLLCVNADLGFIHIQSFL